MSKLAISHTAPPASSAVRLKLRTLLGYACNQAFMFSLFYMGWNSAQRVGGVTFERVDLLVTLLLCIAGYRLGKHLKKRPGPAQVLTEKAVSTLYNLVSSSSLIRTLLSLPAVDLPTYRR